VGAKNWFGRRRLGRLCEYVCAVEGELGPKPANVSFEDAAAVTVAAITALQGLRDKGRMQRDQRFSSMARLEASVLLSVQIAKSYGAEVRLSAARGCGRGTIRLGQTMSSIHAGRFHTRAAAYDLIMAANAYHSLFEYRRALSQDGIYVWVEAESVFKSCCWDHSCRHWAQKDVFLSREAKQSGFDCLTIFSQRGEIVPVIDHVPVKRRG